MTIEFFVWCFFIKLNDEDVISDRELAKLFVMLLAVVIWHYRSRRNASYAVDHPAALC